MTVENVSEFFKNAAPLQQAAQLEEEMFRLMSKENKRWHTDKIMSRFGRGILQAPCGAALDLMSKLMVKLWKEAKMQRKR